MTTTKKVKDLTLIGDIADGDKLVGERTDGTTVRLTYKATQVADGDKGDITVSSSGASWTIDPNVVTYGKIQEVSDTDKLLGRSTSGAGNVEEITCTAAGRALLDDADSGAQRTTLGLGTLATQDGIFSGTSSGTNTGDQTTIVGISGTKSQYNASCSDGDFLFLGDVTQYTDEMAQDAVGAMVDTSLVYTDATPLLQRAALTGDVTASAGSNTTTIANSAVTLAKMANMATSSLIYRKTASSGTPEVNSLATLKTDLGLTGTNSGDQTITLTGDVTGSGTGSFAATITTPSSVTIATDDKVLIKDTSASNVLKYVTTQNIADLVPSTAWAVANGGTGKTSVTTSPTATSWAGWDSNSNMSANNFLAGGASVTSAAGTTTLTVDSSKNQIITGTTTQTVQMPVVSTLVLYQTYIIYNTSTGNVTVNSSGGNLICTVYPNQSAEVICISITGTSASSWLALKNAFLSSSTTSASLSTTTATAITSLSLTPGDWNVWGNFQAVLPGISADFVLGCINTSVALTSSSLYGLNSFPSGGAVPAASRLCAPVPGRILQLSATTTVYLIGYCTFAGGGTITGEGSLFARSVIR